MRKKISFSTAYFLIFLATNTFLHSDFGFKAGVNLSFLMTSEFRNVDEKPYVGFSGGIFYSMDISNWISLQPELHFVVKTSRAKEKIILVSEEISDIHWREFRLILSYIEIPMLIKLNLSKSGDFRPNLFIGPYLALNVDARVKILVEEVKKREFEIFYTDSYEIKENIKDEIDTLDYGILIGGGITIPVSKGKFILDMRVSLAIRDIAEKYENIFDIRNRTLSLTIGYSFN